MSTTVIENFPFDPASSNQVHGVLNNADNYVADEIQFSSAGIAVVRTGTDVNFFPWSSVAKVYQEI